MKKTLLIIFIFSSFFSLAQVGVNNTNPQEEVHVSGATSTIRVEGLNAINNPLNLGPNENTRVYANANGALTRPAIVEINYAVSYEIYKSGNPIDDYHARTAQFYSYLRQGGPAGAIVTTDFDGVAINFAGNPGALGYRGNFYTNGSTLGAGGGEGFGKEFYACGHDYIKLGPGTYCPMFAGILFVADTGGTGAVKMQMGGGDDEVIIVAHYYN